MDKGRTNRSSVNNGALLRAYEANKTKLSSDVGTIKGIGSVRAAGLGRKGICTIEDLVSFIPRTYEDRRRVSEIGSLKPGQKAVVKGRITSAGSIRYWKSRKTVFQAIVQDETGTISAKWFNFSRAQMEREFRRGRSIILSGEVGLFGRKLEFVHPEADFPDKEDDVANTVIPIYSAVEGFSQRQIRGVLRVAVSENAHATESFIPPEILNRRGLLPVPKALSALHCPPLDADIPLFLEGRDINHRSLVFDEFFFLELGLALRRRHIEAQKGIAFNVCSQPVRNFVSGLPFSLTGAQRRVLAEIEGDMARTRPMQRLIQGDVGSGKTVIAFISAITAMATGFQAALMAPTEILAEQHYTSFTKLAAGSSFPVYLLTRNVSRSARQSAYDDMASGKPCLAIGTHALIQEAVQFARLGLAVIDEQHRFGVLQRAALKDKGWFPDVLVMTATPIPRTLAMTLYGDLDISVLDELPKGRKPVKTGVYQEAARRKIYEFVRKNVAQGGQAYIVFPLIDESESMDLLNAVRMAEELQRDVFPEYTVGLIHGRLKSEEKESAMARFRQGEVNVLVSTTVIEVGVDVPNASIMVIEHADRFGLSQLHQLRGRVGRGTRDAYCFLVSSIGADSPSGRRLKIMEETTDGFRIAEEDLKIRGPGDFVGTRQSGLPELRTANILRDIGILAAAREEAFGLVRNDPDLSRPEHKILRRVLEDRWAGSLSLAEVG
ncbi:MAG: ATP-dependent DNA helicase RecG [Pseudomonadota bacterium]